MDYGLYYNKKALKDTMMIVFNSESISDRYIKEDNVIKLYKNNELIGINILNFSSYMKIHCSGLIPLPIDQLVDIINNILEDHHVLKLDYKKSSGFIIGKIIEVNPHPSSEHLHLLKLDIKDKVLDIVCGSYNVKKDGICVVATIGTYLFNGDTVKISSLLGEISYGMCCNEAEVGILNDPLKKGLLYLDDESLIGKDFFNID